MALGACRTLLALFVTLCSPGFGLSDKTLKKTSSVEKTLRPGWESSILLDGTPVDRFVVSSRPGRSHRFTKWDKDSRTNVFEDVDPDWLNLDGFAVLSAAPVNSAVPVRPQPVRNSSSAHRSARVNRTLHPSASSSSSRSPSRTLRRAPQSSSGPRQPERYSAGTPLLERRRFHSTKPQSDQRRQRQAQKLTSESVHVVSLQAPREPGQSATNRDAAFKRPITEPPPEYEARDISVRVMSPKSVLISWVDPAVEMGKVEPGTLRSYTVRYREKGESARWEYKDSSQRRMMIEDLSADGMYEFSVRINQEQGQGKWSVSVFQRTPESAPSGPPENFEVKPLRGKGTAVIATWDPPDEPNGRIREYILSYAPAMKPFGMKSLTFSGSSSSATVDGLTPGDRYIFKIRATNRRGQGPQSKAYSVVMPASSRSASSSSKISEVRRTNQALSEQDTEHEQSNIRTTLPPTTTTTTPTTTSTTTTTTTHRGQKNRRVRPLSQTRSYHSIFSSVRGSVRNGHRGGSKMKEEQTTALPTTQPTTTKTTTTTTTTTTATTTTTTLPPETTTMDIVEETEQNNDVFEENEPLTTKTPSLKIVTPSPTKKVKVPQRRPIKIRIHQKPGSKTSSQTKTSSRNSIFTTTTATTNVQESAAKRMDYMATAYPDSKHSYNTPILSKKPVSSSQDTNVQPEKQSTITSTGTARGTGGFGGRYGNNRRYPNIFHRGNTTRNGFKPHLTSAVSTNAKIPSRNSQIIQNRLSNSENRFNEPNRSVLVASRQETSDGLHFDKTTNTQGSTTYDPQSGSDSRSSLTKPTGNSHSTSNGDRLDKIDTKSDSESLRHTSNSRGNRDNSRDINSQSKIESISHASSSTLKSEKADDGGSSRHTSEFEKKSENNGKQIENSNSKAQGDKTDLQSRTHSSFSKNERNSESDSKTVGTASQPRTEILESTKSEKIENLKVSTKPDEDENSKTEKVKSSSSSTRGSEGERTSSQSRTRISSSLLEKYPWLATRFPHRFGSAARTPNSVSASRQDGRAQVTRPTSSSSSSIGAAKPVSQDMVTRVSGASGAAGVSTLQETSPVSASDKNISKLDSLKNNIGSEPVKTGDSKTVIETRQPATSTSSGTNRQQSLEHIPDNESHGRDYVSENMDKDDQKKPTQQVTYQKLDKEGVNATNTRTVLSSGVSPTIRRPNTGSNGRIRPQFFPNRPFGSRYPVRPAQRTDSQATSEAKPEQTPNSNINNGNTQTRTGELLPSSGSASASSSRNGMRGQGGRTLIRGKPLNGGGYKPVNGNGKNGRPNLTTAEDKEPSTLDESSKSNGHRFITGPDGTKWLVDLERGLLMNSDGKILQDSQGKPKRVVLGEDGRTIFDVLGSPLVNQEGVALFGHGRDSRPVVNPKDKILMVGGKPVLGLDVPKHRTTTTTSTTTTSTTTTTTLAPTTTTESPTTEWTSPPFPTCPPGTYSKIDEYGYPEVDEDGILDCYPIEEESSGMEDFEKDELIPQTTLPPTSTSTVHSTEAPRPSNKGPSNEFDLSGKKRFTAPYVNYIQKDPGAPCSLTEALEYLQVDVLENLLEKDNMVTQNAPPKNKPHNLTVVAMEGCHSFIILDWGRPLKGDMVSGYMVYSASYDDVLNNRWSSKLSSGTHLAVENLKPNSRYYFKVQAKNVFGLGPVSDTLTYVTESDDPLLIERPPGGEPIWIPFTFKYNSAHSSCKGGQYVKRTWYRKFVGVVLCNSLRYKIFMGDGLRDPFYSIGDTLGHGEDHCQFVDSYRDGRTGPAYMSSTLPSAQGYYRAYRQEPVTFGVIGRRTNHPFVGWYECGVPIPGKW